MWRDVIRWRRGVRGRARTGAQWWEGRIEVFFGGLGAEEGGWVSERKGSCALVGCRVSLRRSSPGGLGTRTGAPSWTGRKRTTSTHWSPSCSRPAARGWLDQARTANIPVHVGILLPLPLGALAEHWTRTRRLWSPRTDLPGHTAHPAFEPSASASPQTSVLSSPRTAMRRSRPGRTGRSLRSTVVRLNSDWQEPSTLFHTPTTSSATVGFCIGAVGKILDGPAGSCQCIDTSPGKLVPSVTRSATAFLEGGTLGGNGSRLLPMKGDSSLSTCLFASIYCQYHLEPSIPS